jgi:hypothetical protein
MRAVARIAECVVRASAELARTTLLGSCDRQALMGLTEPEMGPPLFARRKCSRKDGALLSQAQVFRNVAAEGVPADSLEIDFIRGLSALPPGDTDSLVLISVISSIWIAVCTENHIRVYQVTESAKLAQWWR